MKLIVLAGLLLATQAGTAAAQRLEFVGKVAVTGTADSVRPAGDPRYVAVSALNYSGNTASLDVLDLEQTRVTTLQLSRAMLIKAYGHFEPKLGKTMPPEGELVRYDGRRIGLYLSDDVMALPRRHWYIDMDIATGKILKTVVVAALDDRQDLHFIGADPGRNGAWFYVERFDSGRNTKHSHTNGQSEIVFRRVDLRSYAVTDEITVQQPARKMRSGYEDHLMVRHANDYSHFAIVEYDEANLHITPAPQVYIIDPYAKSVFTVPALDTNYGVAFSRDGKYAYLASSRTGTIARVDLAAQKIDKKVAGPALTHHAIVSPNGNKLFVIGSSNKYTVYDLPSLDHRTDLSHAADVAPAAKQLFGGGMCSLDDRYFVMRDAMHKDYSQSHVVVIAKLVD